MHSFTYLIIIIITIIIIVVINIFCNENEIRFGTGLGDDNPIVQNAALFALGQFSEHLQVSRSTCGRMARVGMSYYLFIIHFIIP